MSSIVLQPLLFYTASSHKYPFFFTTLLPIFMGLLGFSLSPCLSETKTTYTDATLAPSTFSLYNYIPLLFSLPLSSIPILIHVLGLRLFLLCFISKFCCGFNGFSPTLSLVFLSLYLIWVSVFWA